MAHDPLCPYKEFIPGEGFWIEEFTDPPKPKQYAVACQCDLISKVRINEREQVLADGPYFTSVVHHCCVELQELRANT